MSAFRDCAAFKRRVVPEGQHQDRREEREERDCQKPGSKAARRVLQIAHGVGSRKTGKVAYRIYQGDTAGSGGATEKRGRQCPKQRRDREETNGADGECGHLLHGVWEKG